MDGLLAALRDFQNVTAGQKNWFRSTEVERHLVQAQFQDFLCGSIDVQSNAGKMINTKRIIALDKIQFVVGIEDCEHKGSLYRFGHVP